MKTIILFIISLTISTYVLSQKIDYVKEFYPADNSGLNDKPLTCYVPGIINIQNDKNKITISNEKRTEVWRIIKTIQKTKDIIEYELETNYNGEIVKYKAEYDTFYLKFTLIYEYGNRIFTLKE